MINNVLSIKKTFLSSFVSEKNLPGVYVNVVEFVDWITNTITHG
jgi:secreted trypsin-like serine protease